MSMHYAAQDWPIAVDLNSAIERLRAEFQDLHFDAEHSSVYDRDYFVIDADKNFEELISGYRMGIILCDEIKNKRITLQTFCEKIIACGLKKFLYNIAEFLPIEYVDVYDLKVAGDTTAMAARQSASKQGSDGDSDIEMSYKKYANINHLRSCVQHLSEEFEDMIRNIAFLSGFCLGTHQDHTAVDLYRYMRGKELCDQFLRLEIDINNLYEELKKVSLHNDLKINGKPYIILTNDATFDENEEYDTVNL